MRLHGADTLAQLVEQSALRSRHSFTADSQAVVALPIVVGQLPRDEAWNAGASANSIP
jgi:hypothetical protein